MGQNWRALAYASLQLRNNKDLVLEGLRQSGMAMQFVGEDLRSEVGCVCAATDRDWLAYEYAVNPLTPDYDGLDHGLWLSTSVRGPGYGIGHHVVADRAAAEAAAAAAAADRAAAAAV